MKNRSLSFKCITMLLFLVYCGNSFSQQFNKKEFDSLLNDYPLKMIKNKIPREKIIKWNLDMLEKAKKEKHTNGIILANINIANQFHNLGKSDKSLHHLEEAKKNTTNKTDNFTLSRIHQEYSQVYYSINLTKTGLKNNSKAIVYAKKIENTDKRKRYLHYIYNTRANFLYAINEKDSALFYLLKAKKMHESIYVNASIANFYIEHEFKPDSAKKYLDFGNNLISKKQFYYTSHDESVLKYCLACLDIKNEKYYDAIKNLETSLKLSKGDDNSQHALNIFEKLAFVYKKTGEISKENEFLEKIKKLNDSISFFNFCQKLDTTH